MRSDINQQGSSYTYMEAKNKHANSAHTSPKYKLKGNIWALKWSLDIIFLK